MMKKLFFAVPFLSVILLSGAVATAQEAVPAAPVMVPPPAVPMASNAQEGFVTPRETVDEAAVKKEEAKIVYNPKVQRDPTLSPDDFLLLQYRERQRLAAEEAERQRKLAEERRRREEAERRRQLELALIKDPTIAVRDKIRVSGIIGKEVFIGSKIYTIGKTVRGAKIVDVRNDEVVFLYKGHKFKKKVQLR